MSGGVNRKESNDTSQSIYKSFPTLSSGFDAYQDAVDEALDGCIERLESDLKFIARDHFFQAELLRRIYHGRNLLKKVTALCEVSNDDVESFLDNCTLYDAINKRWNGIPLTTHSEADLHVSLHSVIKAAFLYFYDSGSRSAVDTSACKFEYDRNEPTTRLFKSVPSICVVGSGRHFQADIQDATEANFSNCVSLIEPMPESKRLFKDNIVQLAIYARQCFIQQHSRKFIYSIIVSEKFAQVYLFTRSGVFYSDNVDIHNEPMEFIRLILGISSMDDEAVGCDTNIFWEGKKRFLKTVNEYKESISYCILGGQPFFSERLIEGRATCCWRVQNDLGNVLVVKDAWVPKGRVPEKAFLQKVRGLPGVSQVVSVEDAICSTAQIVDCDCNCPSFAINPVFRERTLCRIVFKDGGKPIQDFETREEILFALRDAIAGHQRLWEAGILHRDVSVNNILIGPPGSSAGHRGSIIDLDMAIWIRKSLPVLTDTGTRAFQSYSVLKNAARRNRGIGSIPHDHLDELESFFYVICLLAFGYEGPGKKKTPFPAFLTLWQQYDTITASNAKASFFFEPFNPDNLNEYNVPPFFGAPFEKLIGRLHKFFKAHIIRKSETRQDYRRDRSDRLFRMTLEMKKSAAEDYQTVLSFVDEAIEDVEMKVD